LSPTMTAQGLIRTQALNRMAVTLADQASDLVVAGSLELGTSHVHVLVEDAASSTLSGEALSTQRARLQAMPGVLSVEPNYLVHAAATAPNDTYYANYQWYLGASSSNTAAINATKAWDSTRGSTSTVIAVLDTGITSHPDLDAKILPGYDFITDSTVAADGDSWDANASDPGDWSSQGCPRSTRPTQSSWHGTFVTGVLAAVTQNNTGIAGVNWNAKILPVRVLGKCGGSIADVIPALRWAAGIHVNGVPDNPHPANVINLSLEAEGTTFCGTALQTAINEVLQKGAVIVAAAGNEQGVVGAPANCAGVLAVAAVTREGSKTTYSNFGPAVGIAAPGGQGGNSFLRPAIDAIISTSNDGTTGPSNAIYEQGAGTSFATPVTAGVVSLVRTIASSLSPQAVVTLIKNHARPHSSSGGLSTCSATQTGSCNCTTSTCGVGLLDASLAIQAAKDLASLPSARLQTSGEAIPGGTVVLDGRSSTAIGVASLITFAWTQESGLPTSIQSPSSSVTQVTFPASAAGAYVFALKVTDTLGRTDTTRQTLTMPTTASGDSSSSGGAVGMLDLVVLLLSWAGMHVVRHLHKPCIKTQIESGQKE
jgi:serine protease